MDKSLIDKYKSEMMDMYLSSRNTPKVSNTIPPTNADEANTDSSPVLADNTGKLIVTVSTVRSLYPVENARVTVFSGNPENKQTLDYDFTDQSGRTKAFVLVTPSKNLSYNSENYELPYEVYGIEITAEGYIDTVYLNVPIFSGTTSIQQVNMMLLETEGANKGPIIYDTAQQYTLNNVLEE